MHGRLRRIKTIAACGALRILGSTRRRPRHKEPASCVRLCRRLRRSGGDLRARGLVRSRRLVLSAAWAADSARRDHPRQSPSHSRQARRVHRGAFSRRAPVEAKLNETDFASLFSDWLDDPKHSADPGRVMRNLLPAVSASRNGFASSQFAPIPLNRRRGGRDSSPRFTSCRRNRRAPRPRRDRP